MIYFDTSALYKLIGNDAGIDEFRVYVQNLLRNDYKICSSILVKTELKRVAQRFDIPLSVVERILEIVKLIEISTEDFDKAGELKTKNSKYLRSLDALHIVSAQKEHIDFVITFDANQALVFEDFGYKVVKEIPLL